MSDYPDQEAVFRGHSAPTWVDRHVLRSDPAAFEVPDENLFHRFVQECSTSLDVDPNGVYCIGSGAIGLSFNPNKVVNDELKPFDKSSDLDIAIISPFYFERAWRDLRVAASSYHGDPPSNRLYKKIQHQRVRMFDGAIVANELMSHLSFGSEWVTANQRLQYDWADRLNRDRLSINWWIYRDYWSVRNYVTEGIAKCISKIGNSDG